MTADPPCDHLDNYAFRVSSHRDLSEAAERGAPHASTYCCDRDECIRGCREWVEDIAKGPGSYVFPLLRARRPKQLTL